MKKLSILMLAFSVLAANAQTYQINFAGTGLASVKAENLTKGTSVTFNSGEALVLSPTTGISNPGTEKSPGIKIYPNPMTDNSFLEIFPPVAGEATITIFETSGKSITQIKTQLENSPQRFKVSGINTGIYFISVRSDGYQFCEKLISVMKSNGVATIGKVYGNNSGDFKKMSKSEVETNIELLFLPGNVLKFTGTSGNNRTVITDIPTADKTITFTFVACTDGSGNNYPVVNINGKVWMAENLKTTKYSSGGNIPLVNSLSSWYSNVYATSKAYCWYNDDINNKDTYGALYSWAAAMNGAASNNANPGSVQGVCPAGWHLPSHAEWTTMTSFLGGESIAGGKLKETGVVHWTSPNTGADNMSGFTALPAGNRTMYGEFQAIGTNTGWWSSTEQATNYAYRRYLFNNSSDVNSSTANYKSYAYSVRCVKN